MKERFSVAVAARAGESRASIYRPELEGLRAVAAVLVAVWHIWIGGVSGGVDVFFVVSGFLITTTLLGHVDRFGVVKPFMFLGRLARRLIPSAAVVLLVTLGVVWLVTPDALRARAFGEITAAALYFENWQLAFAAVDYLNAEDPATAVQHFWAMSVQGQFYVAWALIFFLAALLAPKVAVRPRALILSILGLVFSTSLAYSVWSTANNQPFAYFDSGARVWEFALGAIAAILITRVSLSNSIAGVLGWLGLLAVILCGTLLPVADAFPGFAALWPTVAALLILFAGSGRDCPGHATHLLSTKPMVWLGSLSYGIYLWHWPILIFARQLLGSHDVGITAGVLILALSLALSWATTTFVERPLRKLSERSAPVRRFTAGALIVALVAIGAVASASQARDEMLAASASRDTAASVSELADAGCFGVEAVANAPSACDELLEAAPLVPQRSELLADTAGAYACYTTADALETEICSFGSQESDAFRVAIVGNSHAAMLVAALRPALNELNWSLDTFVGNGCVWGEAANSDLCIERVAQMDARILEGAPYDLLIASSGRGDRQYSQTRVDEYREAWGELSTRGTEVVVVEDNPRMTESAADCVIAASEAELRNGACDFSEADGYRSPDMMLAAAQQSEGNVGMVRTRNWYCQSGDCPAVIGSVIVYRDLHHLTGTYVTSLTSKLVDGLQAALQ